jgi:hypothetical protein
MRFVGLYLTFANFSYCHALVHIAVNYSYYRRKIAPILVAVLPNFPPADRKVFLFAARWAIMR